MVAELPGNRIQSPRNPTATATIARLAIERAIIPTKPAIKKFNLCAGARLIAASPRLTQDFPSCCSSFHPAQHLLVPKFGLVVQHVLLLV